MSYAGTNCLPGETFFATQDVCCPPGQAPFAMESGGWTCMDPPSPGSGWTKGGGSTTKAESGTFGVVAAVAVGVGALYWFAKARGVI